MVPARSTFLLLLVIASSFWLGSTSDECTTPALFVPSSGPTVCLSFDDYIQLRNKAGDGDTTGAPPVSSTPSQSVSSRTLLLYRYMSPSWLHTHATFAETPSSVSAQTIEFRGPGSVYYALLLQVELIEAGVLDDNNIYTLQFGYFFGPASATDPIVTFYICDNSICAGFYWNRARANFYEGTISAGACTYGGSLGSLSPPQETTIWNVRFEIHPNSTSGIVYVGTSSKTIDFNGKLKPGQGLYVKVCRGGSSDLHQFHLFELAMHSSD